VIFSTLLRPPRAPSRKESSGGAPPKRQALSSVRDRARHYRVAVYTGLVLSVLLHILAVRLSPLIFRYMGPESTLFAPPQPIQAEPQGMQALDIRVVENLPVEATPEPEPEPEPEPVAEEPAETSGAPVAAAERLRPRVGDWRLWWYSPATYRTDMTPAERTAELEARLYAMLEVYDDSMAAELARLQEQMDWTVGEEGNKWGVSPGKIHLGPVTLPLPIYIGPGREAEDMLSDYNAIRRQAGQAEIDESFEARVKAIRERRAREKAQEEAKRDTTSGG
jgi:hypothetical protein